MNRREFISLSLAGAVAMLNACATPVPGTLRRKRILVLGGTNFVGPAIVEHALAQGHEVTLFNRGITWPQLFPAIEKLRGLRAVAGGDLGALQGGRRWDAVIDVWPAQSELVAQTASLLAERCDYYFFISSIAVYRDFSAAGLDEQSPVHENEPGWYGGEKVLCEQQVARYFPERSGVARCHAILGPRDDGHAYHYWLRKMANQQQVLAPGSGEDPVQYVDVRDLAAWVVACIETGRNGIHNIVGSSPPLPLRSFLEGSHEAIGSQAQLVWANADELRKQHGVHSFSDMPLWAPLDEDFGFYQVDGRKALNAGISYRPLAETARDAWRWYQSHFFRETRFPVGGLGLSAEREREVLEAITQAG